MKQIFEGEIYEVVPQSGGVVFSYRKSVIDQQVLVAYKMLSVDTGVITDVAKNIYLLSKFGSNYRAAANQCGNFITSKALVLPSGKVFICSNTGRASLIDGDGTAVWTGELKYRGFSPSDIAIYKNALWACYSQNGVLIRFNLNTMREELRIGGTRSPFDRPRDIYIYGDCAIISNTGSKKLVKVDLNSYTVSDYKEFTEPVYSYVKVKNYEFVLMESGLYVL